MSFEDIAYRQYRSTVAVCVSIIVVLVVMLFSAIVYYETTLGSTTCERPGVTHEQVDQLIGLFK